MAELYGELASISAILAGFSIPFLALLLGHQDRGRCLIYSIAVTVAAASSLLVSALGWSLIGSLLTQVAAQQGATAAHDMDLGWVASGHRTLSFAFVLGLVFPFLMLGLSGWMRSRVLGIFSTVTETVFCAPLRRTPS